MFSNIRREEPRELRPVMYICLEKCVDMTQLKHPVCSNDGHKPRQRGKRLHHEDAEMGQTGLSCIIQESFSINIIITQRLGTKQILSNKNTGSQLTSINIEVSTCRKNFHVRQICNIRTLWQICILYRKQKIETLTSIFQLNS